ncbi:MAG TPA: molybdate ABC transporter substrate-binding protein [Stellaceae bacterium]|nr:molybdate ABC transporter substrate-binding protein [Stellaceae bacterium]
MLSGLKRAVGGLTLSLLLMVEPAAIAPARAEYVVAPDVVVFCEPTLRHAVTDLGAVWRKQTGIPVRVFTSPTWALLEQISHRARSDIVIGEGEAASTAATERHLIKPETLQPLWRNQLVVAATVGEIAKAKSASPARAHDLATLAGHDTIALVDPATALAGAEGKKALQDLGLWEAASARSVGVVDTVDASFLLAEGKVQLALVYATDVAADPAFAVTDKLPAASYAPIVYWIAQTANALSPNAEKFAAFLREAQTQERLRADGLEVLP